MTRRMLPVLLFVFIAGCGDPSPRQSIYGTITLDGEPVASGTIRFAPASGTEAPAVGGTIEDGEYELDEGEGPLPGDYKVLISSPKQGEKEIEVYPGAPPGYESVETIPPRYNTQTSLTVTVKEGGNEKDFELKTGDESL